MTDPTPLSPAARAAWEAFNSKFDWVGDGVPGPQFHSLAAALEALADQVVPEGGALMIRMPETDVDGNELGGMLLTAEPNDHIRRRILRIAAELRGGNNL